MKIKLLSLAGAAVCCAALNSCVAYDDYGYYGAAPVGSNLYVADDGYGYGYGGYGYAPAYSNFSLGFFGLGGRGYSSYYDRDHHHHHHYSGSPRSSSDSRNYAASVARPSSFRGAGSGSSAPRIPSASAPLPLSRPSSIGSSSRPSRSYSSPPPAVRSAPRIESRPAPSSRPSRASMTTASTRPSSASRPSSSDRRRER